MSRATAGPCPVVWRDFPLWPDVCLGRSRQCGKSGRQVDADRSTQAGERLALRESRAKVSSLNRQLAESQSTTADQANALKLALKVSPLLRCPPRALFKSAFRKSRRLSSVAYKACTCS